MELHLFLCFPGSEAKNEYSLGWSLSLSSFFVCLLACLWGKGGGAEKGPGVSSIWSVHLSICLPSRGRRLLLYSGMLCYIMPSWLVVPEPSRSRAENKVAGWLYTVHHISKHYLRLSQDGSLFMRLRYMVDTLMILRDLFGLFGRFLLLFPLFFWLPSDLERISGS